MPGINSGSISTAVLQTLPTSILITDENDRILLANSSACRLLKTPRHHLEGGALSRFFNNDTKFSSTAQDVKFKTTDAEISLIGVGKELVVDGEIINIILLKTESGSKEVSLTDLVSKFAGIENDPFEFICNALVDLNICKYASVRQATSTECNVLASSTQDVEVFSSLPSISKTISNVESTQIDLVVVPNTSKGINKEDISTIDMFISLVNGRVVTEETASDASGSETALALALKAGDMGLVFFDTERNECYLSDRLATWCSINPETFSGSITDWLATFRDDDRSRVKKLFGELSSHNKFKTIINLETLEQDMRLELTGRPLEDQGTTQWVAIARPYRDEEEVQASWQTRIAMEESARKEAEELLENFEKTLINTMLPTTSDVKITQSRQDAGTWHIVRPLGMNSCIYALGAVTAANRSQAVVDATILTTIADVLASEIKNLSDYVDLLRDHARARDIETTIAAVKVVDGNISSATYGGASVYISGRSFTGDISIEETTALSLSTHSQATPETIEVASNGRPWKIMSTVVEIINLIETFSFDKTSNESQEETLPETNADEKNDTFEEDLGNITGQNYSFKSEENRGENVAQFRSGSINPSN